MLQNFLYPQRDQPLLLPVDMREWLPEDDLAFMASRADSPGHMAGINARIRAGARSKYGRMASSPVRRTSPR